MLRISCVVGLLAFVAVGEARAQSPADTLTSLTAARSPTDALLDRLVGDWRMVGRVRGRPATYTLAARRVLNERFVELHMTDTSRPPQYEARVFVGADTVPGKVIVHWLDSFGAAFSIPHATGSVLGDTLRFEFPYRTGPFRDTFVYHPATHHWVFRLEASDGLGGWRLFAEYDVRPSPGQAR